MLKKRIFSIILCLCMILSVLSMASCSSEEDKPSTDNGVTDAPATDAPSSDESDKKDEKIAILFENDVHCAVDGYAKIGAMKTKLTSEYDYVGVVSSGDFIQGGTLGAISRGEYIIDIMNTVKYDAVALGNHEFDYKLDRLKELRERLNTKVLSCNFTEIGSETPYFDAYNIVTYGDVKIAYIGITTPETITSSAPSQFMNDKGEMIYSFNESKLSEIVQKNIDKVKAEGADYVIALAHIGYCETGELSDITDIIANTDGFDAVLDGHSHSVIEKMLVKDKSGDEVVLSSTGTKFEYIGKLTIVDGKIETTLQKVAEYTETDTDVKSCIDKINQNYAQLGERKIAVSNVDLITHDKDGNRLVRMSETNLGNLCADSFREIYGTDISFVNGGGIRASIEKGEVTFNDVYSVFPFNNEMVTAEISGQMLIDMLELAVMCYPAEDGSFPHVSGITFSVNKAIPSSVKLDSNGLFVDVEGDYRVYDVMILDKATGTYKPLDYNAKYTIAATNHVLLDFGGGMTMLKDAKVLQSEGTLDVEVLERYIVENLGGVIGDKYATVDNRITFTEGYATAELLMAA